MVELKQTKLSDRSTVGRVWDSEFEGYRFDSRNRQIFATSENSKLYFSNIIQILCYLETLICLIIFVNNIDLLQVVSIYSLMSLNVLILRSKNSLQTDCIISRFEYTVSLIMFRRGSHQVEYYVSHELSVSLKMHQKELVTTSELSTLDRYLRFSKLS